MKFTFRCSLAGCFPCQFWSGWPSSICSEVPSDGAKAKGRGDGLEVFKKGPHAEVATGENFVLCMLSWLPCSCPATLQAVSRPAGVAKFVEQLGSAAAQSETVWRGSASALLCVASV